MYSKLLSYSRGLYLAGIVLALVLVIPTAWFPFQLAKLAVFAACLGIAAIMFVVGGGTREVVRAHGFYGVLLVALLPLSYLLSMLFSIDPTVGWSGFGVEADTVLFTVLAFLGFAMSFTFFRTLRTVRLLLSVVFWALVAAMVFQFISIMFGTAVIPFSTFADRSVNLVGKWNDLGILAGLLSMFLLARAQLSTMSTLWRSVIALALGVLALLLGIINFSLVWGLVLVFSLALIAVALLMQKGEAPTHWAQRAPWFPIAAAVVSVLFLLFGTSLNTGLTKMFPVSSLEVRPSYSSTLGIINEARDGSFSRVLVGTGPNTFGQQWIMHKPAEVNQTAFWGLDFNVGFSTLVTALGSVGLLGVLAWLIPAFLVLAALVRVVRLGVLTREDKIIATTLGISSLFAFTSLVLYAPSQNLILLAFILTGAAFGFLWRQGRSSVEPSEVPNRYEQLSKLVAVAVLLVLALWSGFATSRRLIAQAYVGMGAVALSEGNSDMAVTYANKSNNIERNGDALRLIVNAFAAEMQKLAQSDSKDTAALQQQFAAVVQQALTAAQEAQKINPQDYRSTFILGQIYDFLASLKVQGAVDTATETYLAAQKLNPTNPSIPLALARLHAGQGNKELTTKYVTEALTLKQNYTDAILLVVQLNVANNDIPNAIKAATAAAQTAPGVAPIWFQLGLLYYSAGDAEKAAAALEQAVNIQKDYANAKYFLGLSYAVLKKNAEAIQQFQDLAKSNPESEEVKLILSNLQAGKDPFDGAKPPVTSNPQNRPTAPLSQ